MIIGSRLMIRHANKEWMTRLRWWRGRLKRDTEPIDLWPRPPRRGRDRQQQQAADDLQLATAHQSSSSYFNYTSIITILRLSAPKELTVRNWQRRKQISFYLWTFMISPLIFTGFLLYILFPNRKAEPPTPWLLFFFLILSFVLFVVIIFNYHID
jgi:hypothetical protein